MDNMDYNNYWENEIKAYWEKEFVGMDTSITVSDLKSLDPGHIYAALFREMEAECPTTRAIALYCFRAVENHYYNEMIADKYLPEAEATFNKMYYDGLLPEHDREYLAKSMKDWGGEPSDHWGGPDLREAVWQHYYKLILKTLGLKIPSWFI